MTFLTSLWQAFTNSLQGLKLTFQSEKAFQRECFLLIGVIPTAFYLSDCWITFALLVGVTLLVLLAELLNTAVEKTIDRISDDHNPLSGFAKDAGSAAVLMSLLIWLLVWFCYLLDMGELC